MDELQTKLECLKQSCGNLAAAKELFAWATEETFLKWATEQAMAKRLAQCTEQMKSLHDQAASATAESETQRISQQIADLTAWIQGEREDRPVWGG